MRLLRLVLVGMSWLFFAAAVGWLVFGPDLLAKAGCEPAGAFGCGAVEADLPSALIALVNIISRVIVALLFLAAWAAILWPGGGSPEKR